MAISAFSRLAALVAAALIVVGCGTGARSEAPAAAPTVAPQAAESAAASPAAELAPTAAPAQPEPTAAVVSPAQPEPTALPLTPAPAATTDPGQPEPTAAPLATGPAATGQPEPTAAPALPAQGLPAPLLGYTVVNSYPHDPNAFTQGLVYIGDDSFYEGTGLIGRSTLREVALDGVVRRSQPIDANHFGEGVAVVDDRIFQLTWQNCVGYIYDRATFAEVRRFSMPLDPRSGSCLEGWGLTFDGRELILSDGSERLFFVDPAATERDGALAVTGQIAVADAGTPVQNLNELEYINGQVFANVWLTDQIVRVDPATGAVTARIDLTNLRAQLPEAEWGDEAPEVLNGIAYDAAADRLFVTGKLWPRLFEIDLIGAITWFVYLPLVAAA
jgi:glutamine cyclotransferase